jgi:hypothetical protein
MKDYNVVLHTVAENPGLEVSEISELVSIDDEVAGILSRASEAGDVICVNDCWWVVRKGEFSYYKYDHPEP